MDVDARESVRCVTARSRCCAAPATSPATAESQDLRVGFTFSERQADYLNVPWRDAFQAATRLSPGVIRLGAYWEYDRRWHYQLSFEHGERESNLLGRNYRFNAGIAQVRFVF